MREQSNQLSQPPVLKQEFFETDDFRAAFGSEHIGKVFKVYRNHPRHLRQYGKALNQELLGRWLGLTQAQVSKLENGKPEHNLDALRRYAQILHFPQHLLWFDLPGQSRLRVSDFTFTTEEEESEPSINRRTLIAWGAASAVTYAVSDEIGAVGVSDIARLQRKTARLHRLDQRYGSDSLWQSAISYANESRQLLENGRYTGDIGQELLKTAGKLQILAGWLAFDAGKHDVARSCYTEALGFAQQANDGTIETRALANLAFQSNTLGRPREGLRFANAAARVASRSGASTRLVAIPYLRVAVAQSLMDNAGDSTRAITLARKALEGDTDAPTEAWNTFLSQSEIDAVEATCALELHEASKAEKLLQSSIDRHADRNARNRTLYQVRLAKARVDQRELEGAVEALTPALDDLSEEISSWRVAAELDTVSGLLSRHRHVSKVDVFLHRLTMTQAIDDSSFQ